MQVFEDNNDDTKKDASQASGSSVNALYDQLQKEPLDADELCGNAEELAMEVVEVVSQGTDKDPSWQKERLPGMITEIKDMLLKLTKLKSKHQSDPYGHVIIEQIGTFETFLKEHPIPNGEEPATHV